jgi:hypothetical protein
MPRHACPEAQDSRIRAVLHRGKRFEHRDAVGPAYDSTETKISSLVDAPTRS